MPEHDLRLCNWLTSYKLTSDLNETRTDYSPRPLLSTVKFTNIMTPHTKEAFVYDLLIQMQQEGQGLKKISEITKTISEMRINLG